MKQVNKNFTDMSDIDVMQTGEVYDEGDLAQQLQMQEMANLTKNKLHRPESHPDFDGKHCIDCDSEIPEARLKDHRIRCTSCQELIEKRNLR